MLPSQQPENFATHSFGTSSQSPPHEEALINAHAMAPIVYEEFLFHGFERNDGSTAVSSALEELMSTGTNCMCTDNNWFDYGSTIAGNNNAEDVCSPNFWDNLLEPVSQSPILSQDATSSSCMPIFPAYFSGETAGMIPALVQPSQASSVAAYQPNLYTPYLSNEHLNVKPYTRSNSINAMHTSVSTNFFSSESCGECLANTDASFIHPSPVYSEVSSMAVASQHNSFYMTYNSSDHLDEHMGVHENGTNYVHTSIAPKFSYDDVCMAYTGSTASNIASSADDDFVESEASSLLTFGSAPPHDLNLAIPGAGDPAVMGSWSPQTRASPLHEASSYRMKTEGSSKDPKDSDTTKDDNTVTFLVESSTTAIEDGYVWRKYGQKAIKDRAHPRSYYRCAQPDCPIKKQTESSSEEQGFVLITYIGRHNH